MRSIRTLAVLAAAALATQAQFAVACTEARAAQRVEALAELIAKQNPRARCAIGAANYQEFTDTLLQYHAICHSPERRVVYLVSQHRLERSDPFTTVNVGGQGYLIFTPLAVKAEAIDDLIRSGAVVQLEDFERAVRRAAIIAERNAIEDMLRGIGRGPLAQ